MKTRMRYISQAVADIRAIDPASPINARMIKRLVNEGIIPAIRVGNGKRRLINLDALLEYLDNPQADQPIQTSGIRRVPERG